MKSLHTHAWLVWLVAAAVLALSARNPLYLLLLLLSARLVAVTCARPDATLSLPLLRLGLLILFFATTFNALFVHIGSTVLFHLPAAWPLIGGAITLEAAVYGAINGLVLWTLLAVFDAINQIIPTANLVRLTPRALRDLGVVILIAVTYVPQTIQQVQRIQEAQAIRGNRLRHWRDWRPVLTPLLVGGLERAMVLAETMVARGYGSTSDAQQTWLVRLLLLLALALAFSGWLWSFWVGWPGWLLLAAGLLLLAGWLWQAGQQVSVSRYRAQPWTSRDMGLVVTAVLPLLLLLWPWFDRSTLSYSPYLTLSLPPFDPILGAVILCLVYPALIVVRST
ncbi:MAG: energy-coupling factor transporter transmembrane component T [Chloroflexota bacterium]